MSASDTGLRLTVHRSKDNGSNNGLSSDCDWLTLVGWIDVDVSRTPDGIAPRDRVNVQPLQEHSCGPFTPHEGAPAVILVYRRLGNRRLVHVEPLEPAPRGSYMAGGTYLTGDSRFSDLIGFYGAVAFHDRSE